MRCARTGTDVAAERRAEEVRFGSMEGVPAVLETINKDGCGYAARRRENWACFILVQCSIVAGSCQG